MTKPDKDVVADVRARLARRIGADRYDLWFGTQTRLVPEGDTLLVVVPNRFYQDWLRRNFREDLATSYREAVGSLAGDYSPRLEFRLAADVAPPVAANRGQPAGVSTVPPVRSSLPCASVDGRRAPQHLLALKPAVAEAAGATPAPGGPQRRFASLASLVSGESNRLAAHSARMVLESPGKMNPFVVHGPTGVGKTHVLEGMYVEAQQRSRGQAAYFSAEQFTNGFLEALRGTGVPNFRRKYRGVHWLFIDDLHFFCGKKATVGELLHTIDACLREGRQLVLASDRPPQELPALGEELITRLQGGLSCAMQPPDMSMRLGIVRGIARELQLALPDDVVEFIAANLTAHARELAGAVKLLKVTCQAHGATATLEMARETLADMIRSSSPVIGLAEIEQAVCGVFGLEPKTLQTARGSRHVNQPRMLAMWLARKYTRVALTEIGRYFGRRSHSTVISAQKKVDGWRAQGRALRVSDREWPAEEGPFAQAPAAESVVPRGAGMLVDQSGRNPVAG